MRFIRTRARLLLASGASPLLISIAVVQGRTYAGQLIAAWLLPPAEFAVVRIGEVAVGLVLLIASLGLPSQVVVEIAVTDESQRPAVLGRFALLAAVTGFVASLAGALFVMLLLGSPASRPVAAVVCTAALTSISRTLLSYFQGARQFTTYLVVTSAVTLTALVALVTLIGGFGIPGWIAARWAGEVLLLLSVGALLWNRLSFSVPPGHYEPVRLLRRGATISSSLILRMLTEGAGLFALAYFGRAPDEIAHLGLATLAASLILMGPAALVAAALPDLTRRLRESLVEGWPTYRRLTRRTGLAAGAIAIAVAVTSVFALRLMETSYAPAAPLIVVMAACAVFRSLMTAAGSVFISLHRTDLAVRVQAPLFICLAVLLSWIVPRWGAIGAAWSTLIFEAVGAFWLLASARRLRHQGLQRVSEPAS